jgi:hypothetical protein
MEREFAVSNKEFPSMYYNVTVCNLALHIRHNYLILSRQLA